MPQQQTGRPCRDLRQAAKRLHVIADQLDAIEGDWQINELVLADFESAFRHDIPDPALQRERLQLKADMLEFILEKCDELSALAEEIPEAKLGPQRGMSAVRPGHPTHVSGLEEKSSPRSEGKTEPFLMPGLSTCECATAR